MRRRTWVALLLGAVLAACQPAAEEQPASEESAPVAVVVAPAGRGPITAEIAAGGETAALRTVRIASPVTGRITALDVQPGDRLAAGAVAARVLPLENESVLHGFGVMADAGALRGDDRAMAEQLAREIRAHDIALRAPFRSVVANRLHNPDEQVSPSDVLLELYDPDSLVVLAQLPAQASSIVRPGMAVDVIVAAARRIGHVVALLPAVAPQALTVTVRIALDEPLDPPLLGAAASCRIIVARHDDALLLPLRALISSTVADRGTVMVADGERARRRDVQLGIRGDALVEVLAGLAPGELVIIDGAYALPDGAPIAPRSATPGEDAAP